MARLSDTTVSQGGRESLSELSGDDHSAAFPGRAIATQRILMGAPVSSALRSGRRRLGTGSICGGLVVVLLSGFSGCGRAVVPVSEIVPSAEASAISTRPVSQVSGGDSSGTSTAERDDSRGLRPAALPAPVFGPDDWPSWRGPHHDGVAPGPAVVTHWSPTENVLWRTKLPGRGHSSPIILGEMVYLTTADEQRQYQSVIAIDRRRGRLAWETDLFSGGFETRMHPENSQASSTLTTDGERLFAVFLNDGKVWCSALAVGGDEPGKELWRTEVGPFASKFGYSASPEVYGSLVLIAADGEGAGFVAGLHRGTGQVVYRRKRLGETSYCSPRVLRFDGHDRLFLSGCGQVTAYDPLSGEELWSTKGTAKATVGSVVTDGELIFASGGFPDQDTIALTPAGKVVWRAAVKTYVPSMVVVDGHLYTVQDDGIARCWHAKSGQERWKFRLGDKYRVSLLASAGNLITTNMAGKTTVFRADPEQFTLVAENQLGTEGFASPAVSRGELFCRVPDSSGGTRQEWLYCLGTPRAANALPRDRTIPRSASERSARERPSPERVGSDRPALGDFGPERPPADSRRP